MKYKTIIFIILALIVLVRGYFELTDDFRISNIIYPMKERKEWNFPLSEQDQSHLSKILDQKYYYLGKGAQVYAFGSEDGKYVLKFFKFKHLKPSPFIALLPSIGPLTEIKEKNLNRKLRKLEGVFEGHVLAYKHDKENSGLLYLHLNPTRALDLKAHLVDKIGIEREVDLNPIVFILQKRGETLRTVFNDLFSKGETELAAVRASQILDMYMDEYKRGVWDRDHGISHNTGFIGSTPFHLDVGKLSYDATIQQEFYQEDLIHVARKINAWVKANYPKEYEEFHPRVERHLQELLSRSHLSPLVP